MLISLGLNVYDASDSQSFIQLMDTLQDRGEQVDMYILDLILPGDMGGEEMATVITERDESPYIVVSSGYSPEFIVAEYKQYSFDNVLRKPYSVEELQSVLSICFKE